MSGPDAARQLELLAKLQTFPSPPFLMGGVAEDALFEGGFTRPHGDLDLLVERSQLGEVLTQLRSLGYDSWETKGENAAGEPFYLASVGAPVLIEIGVADRDERGDLFFEVARVHFKLETGDPPVGYRVYLPADTFDHPPTPLEGIQVRCVSPLANYQLRVGIASRGTFGALRESDKVADERLRAKFFPTADALALRPRVESL